MRIVPGDLDDGRIVALLQVHLHHSRAETAPGSAHALDLEGLRGPEIDFWALWDGEELVGIGALKRLDAGHGEVKSMHTANARRRTGAASRILRHLVEAAKAKRMTRLSLETGSWPYFAPARAFYARHGFAVCPPFGAYRDDPNSVFMTLDLMDDGADPAA